MTLLCISVLFVRCFVFSILFWLYRFIDWLIVYVVVYVDFISSLYFSNLCIFPLSLRLCQFLWACSSWNKITEWLIDRLTTWWTDRETDGWTEIVNGYNYYAIIMLMCYKNHCILWKSTSLSLSLVCVYKCIPYDRSTVQLFFFLIAVFCSRLSLTVERVDAGKEDLDKSSTWRPQWQKFANLKEINSCWYHGDRRIPVGLLHTDCWDCCTDVACRIGRST